MGHSNGIFSADKVDVFRIELDDFLRLCSFSRG